MQGLEAFMVSQYSLYENIHIRIDLCVDENNYDVKCVATSQPSYTTAIFLSWHARKTRFLTTDEYTHMCF